MGPFQFVPGPHFVGATAHQSQFRSKKHVCIQILRCGRVAVEFDIGRSLTSKRITSTSFGSGMFFNTPLSLHKQHCVTSFEKTTHSSFIRCILNTTLHARIALQVTKGNELDQACVRIHNLYSTAENTSVIVARYVLQSSWFSESDPDEAFCHAASQV